MEQSLEYMPLVLGLILIISMVSLIFFLRAYTKFNRLNRHLEEMLSDSGTGLYDLVNTYLKTMDEFREVHKELAQRLDSLEAWSPKAMQKLSLKRYNAFDGVGGDQSFSVSLIDGNGEGLVLSGLYGRDDTRVYAKPVKRGQSPYPLSEEEQAVVEAALEK